MVHWNYYPKIWKQDTLEPSLQNMFQDLVCYIVRFCFVEKTPF